MWQIMYDRMATKSTKPITHYRNVPFITKCMGKALHDLTLSTMHIYVPVGAVPHEIKTSHKVLHGGKASKMEVW